MSFHWGGSSRRNRTVNLVSSARGLGNWGGVDKLLAPLRKRRRSRSRKLRPTGFLERLEERLVLSGIPIAKPDLAYATEVDTALVIGSGNHPLLENDWDPEGSSLTASVVTNPANGTLSNFSSSAGTFTYTPDTSYIGIDTFTYKVNDGTSDSETVTVAIAVGKHFGPRTNLEEQPRAFAGGCAANTTPLHFGASCQTGDLEYVQALTPSVSLVYNSATLPRPIIALETFLQATSDVPDQIDARLTFNGTNGTTYSYDTTGLSAGDDLRFALQADATSLAFGRYAYTVRLTAWFDSTAVDHDYGGHSLVVNRGGSSEPFGRGWQLAGLDQLVSGSGGMLLVRSTGDALWFAEDGQGGYEYAAGDELFSTLVENQDSTFTLTDKHGIQANFSSAGLLTSRVDRNGNTTTYTYSSGLLTQITDPFDRDTDFTYTSGRLTSVTDFAGRTATLSYTDGNLTTVTQPDPDGAGSLAAPVWDFAYNETSELLTSVTNPLDDATGLTYGSHNRLTGITHPDSAVWQLTALQTIGMPSGTSGNSLTGANPQGTVTDERSKDWKFRADRLGNISEWKDPLGNTTTLERQAQGMLTRVTLPDPDGGGSQTSPVTTYGRDAAGNLVLRKSPRGYSSVWTYTTFNLPATSTDQLENVTAYSYDVDGNMTELTDPDDNEWSFTYDSGGRVTQITAPDPDGAGALEAPVTSYSYDAYGRLDTITYPDATTVEYGYDSADNITSATDELEQARTFSYDALGRLTSVTDRESATTTFQYDSLGQRTTVTNARDHDTIFEYNTRGWTTSVTQPDPDGSGSLSAPETTYGYDAAGNLTQVGAIDFLGNAQLSYEYDNAGRRVLQDGPGNLGEVVTEFVYDNIGRLTKVIDPLDAEVRYEYDPSGNVTKIMRVQSGLAPPYDVGPATLYAYDAAERVTDMTDPRGYVTSQTYNSRGLVDQILSADPDGAGPMGRAVTTHFYDAMGRLIAVEDFFCRSTTYEYDSRSRIVQVTQPDPDWGGALAAPETSYDYDAAGRLTSVTDPLARVTGYEYDGEGRMITITLPDPDGAGGQSSPEISYAYNALGQVTSETDALAGVTSYSFDALQRIVQITRPDPDGAGGQSAPQTSYIYNAQGKLDTITDPLGRETTYEYDNFGRRTAIQDDSGNETSFSYNALDLVVSVTQPDPDGTGPLSAPVTTYDYDGYHRLDEITDPNSGHTLFTYDAAGNLLSLRDPAGNDTTFAYDGLGRLTMETNELNDSRSYYYDAAGRLTRRVDRNDRVRQYT